MENFKEIAEKCLKGELQGIFILADDIRLISDRVGKSPIKGHFHFDCIDGIFDKFGFCKGFYDRKSIPEYNVVDFIPYNDMETKEIKIEVPEGYVIDKEKSSFEKIIFKKKIKYPESWDECIYKNQFAFGFNTGFKTSDFVVNLLDKQSSYSKLLLLRQEWIHIWSQEQELKEDWNNLLGYSIEHDVQGRIFISHGIDCFPLRFPERKLAINFVNCFRDLLEKAEGLY